MGNPMAQNLIKAGCDVTVWNRTKSKCEPIISLGAKYKSSSEEVAASCDVTFAMLTDPESAMLRVENMELQKEWVQEKGGVSFAVFICYIQKKFKWIPHYTNAIRRNFEKMASARMT
ncbi:hypothetical protein AABB24_009551 [Solanum stoloniferum]|uniref:6-phosphogluconate dehydrogenase NADP-binding domain-containing protein n=1 Tax=Solanum stoloniferum TaxID=62892 RepID=A0ABD2UJ14_9SOLN